ncbi:MAG: MFS transporter [Candidatus Bathyarchaeota archaeon]|nr:MAG: MFS transporter [Candidatus Bathyarchaeota archaeon]
MNQANEATFRSYLFFWSGQLVSLLGSSIAQFVIIWWVTLQTESAIYLSIASFVGFVPQIVLSPFAGVLADRWSRKKISGVTDFLQALATIVLILLFWLDAVSIWLILLLLAVRGAFQAFHTPTVSAITPTMVPQDKLSRMNGLNTLFTGAINLMGPVVAALLLAIWEIHQILWIDAFTFLLALVPLLLIVIPSVRKPLDRAAAEHKPSFSEEFAAGLGFIRNARGLMPLLITATMLNFSLTPLSTQLPYYIRVDHFGGPGDLAFVAAFFGAGSLLGGLTMSILKGFKRKMATGVLFVYVIFVGYTIIALTPTGMFWVMALGALVGSFAPPVFNVSLITILQTVVPLQMQGRVNSVLTALATAAMPVAMIISGPLAEYMGTSYLFLGCVVVGVATLTVSWFFTDMKHVEDMEASSSETPPSH